MTKLSSCEFDYVALILLVFITTVYIVINHIFYKIMDSLILEVVLQKLFTEIVTKQLPSRVH